MEGVSPMERTWRSAWLEGFSTGHDFFCHVYRNDPILENEIVTRDNVIEGLEAGCDRSNENLDLQVPVALDSSI
jgi:hypothetical protein